MQGDFVMRNDLIRLLCEKSFKFSETPSFRLVSGRMSRYYVNCKPTTLHPLGMYLAGHLVFEAVADLGLDAVGGMTFGADPIAVATAFASQLRNRPLKAFSIRKTRKDHGIIRWIEGDLEPGARVAVIEDVVTTGGSTLQAIARAREEGLQVERVVVLVDRQEGGMAAIRQQVPDTVAIVTRDELLSFLGREPLGDE
jgi:orotate phosphoribosyltransferase